MDKIGFWNIRGLNSPVKHPEVRWFLKSNKIGLCGILETRVKCSNFPKIFNSVCDGWSVVTNYSNHRGGRIWVIWLPQMFQVNIIECHTQFIHYRVEHRATGRKFYVTFLYGMNEASDREDLWIELQRVSTQVRGAWMVGGDFNNVLHLNERIGSPVTLSEVEGFRNCMRGSGLNEHKTTGAKFTWSNKQEGGDRVYSRIDRVIANDEWDEVFRNAIVKFLPECIFDHSPCVISFEKDECHKPKAFRFFNMWTHAEEFMDKIQEVWREGIDGVLMFVIVKKLKGVLKELNRVRFSNIEVAADEAKEQMLTLQEALHNDPTNERNQQLENEARIRYFDLYRAKSSFLKQKAKQDWLNKGDMNTKYFHACIKKRRLQNHIYRIKDKQGNMREDRKGIEEAFIEYYKELLGSTHEMKGHVSQIIIQEGKVLSRDQQIELCAEFTDADIKAALWEIEDNKAPGPDGYNSYFYKKAWPCVGQDICAAVKEFFHSGKLLKQINATNICLIPKIEQPTDVTQFRPIACCNVLYKIITKLMCTRLAVVLPSLIAEVQSAFVANRRIMHNILICQDMLKHYKRKSQPLRCTFKIDLRKA
ncbi:uncharacterized protein LOC104899550 [Beta vulgaris subsp. vulgaris]|uniref:uncharacterized protein LOC104899550 n=1 Tax=Beta vulgaris subsp. vulgaris TaxID=3555 RepID=UPI00053FC7BD|nr:uncharacterized protein LOC104899550 [Beta vulgaris subsp. vulgaris]